MGLYLICTSARTGGNVLCSTLTQTGIQEKNNTINRSSDLAWLHETNLLQNLDGPIERLRFFYEHLKASNMLEYLKNIHNFLPIKNLPNNYCRR